jgi:hypothetical protein
MGRGLGAQLHCDNTVYDLLISALYKALVPHAFSTSAIIVFKHGRMLPSKKRIATFIGSYSLPNAPHSLPKLPHTCHTPEPTNSINEPISHCVTHACHGRDTQAQ